MIFTNGLGNRFNVIEKGNEANGNCLFESLSYLDLKDKNKSLTVNNIHKNARSLRKKLYNNFKDFYNNQLSNEKYKANDWQSIKDIFAGGIGSGVGTSSEKLSDYFITKAEQYQPVISIDEGITVDVVFQEGFSLEVEEDDRK